MDRESLASEPVAPSTQWQPPQKEGPCCARRGAKTHDLVLSKGFLASMARLSRRTSGGREEGAGKRRRAGAQENRQWSMDGCWYACFAVAPPPRTASNRAEGERQAKGGRASSEPSPAASGSLVLPPHLPPLSTTRSHAQPAKYGGAAKPDQHSPSKGQGEPISYPSSELPAHALPPRSQSPAFIALLSSTFESSTNLLADLYLFLSAVLSDSLAQIVARQALTEYVGKLASIADRDARKEVMGMSLSKMQPRVTSFEEQVSRRT